MSTLPRSQRTLRRRHGMQAWYTRLCCGGTGNCDCWDCDWALAGPPPPPEAEAVAEAKTDGAVDEDGERFEGETVGYAIVRGVAAGSAANRSGASDATRSAVGFRARPAPSTALVGRSGFAAARGSKR